MIKNSILFTPFLFWVRGFFGCGHSLVHYVLNRDRRPFFLDGASFPLNFKTLQMISCVPDFLRLDPFPFQGPPSFPILRFFNWISSFSTVRLCSVEVTFPTPMCPLVKPSLSSRYSHLLLYFTSTYQEICFFPRCSHP